MLLGTAPALPSLHLLPRPRHVAVLPCAAPLRLRHPLVVSAGVDAGALAELRERWRALGIPAPHRGRNAPVRVVHAPLGAQAYTLDVDADGVRIRAGDADGAFYAVMTLAQLAQHDARGWYLPCVHIGDRPALRWRILSDDVSRGPLPTMQYFKERIRTIAAFKMNGYSPYMENVFISPTDPLPAPLDGITPAQLHELAIYATRFHVAFIPEQQTFGHMHNTLKYERYAHLGEEPHGYLLSPAIPGGAAYATRLIHQELAQVPHPPFFHIGSDEPITLGTGPSQPLVTRLGRSRVYADHVQAMARALAGSGARPMLWDDAIESDPGILTMIPRESVIVNWHYGVQKTYMPYISLIANAGFAQMVAPGASNWSEIFPDVHAAISNERTFINEGKSSHVLGLFQTVWMDDGETLYEATWYPVLYAASAAWEKRDVTPERFAADFPHAFFGVDDVRYADDVANLADILTRLEAAKYDWTDYLFWADAFDPQIAARMANVDLRTVRLEAETTEQHLLLAKPPLHANAAFAMFLAARRYDILARKFQIAAEVRTMYHDARVKAGTKNNPTLRELLWCRYWFWELRDSYEGLAPLYARAWRYENRPGHLAENLERYHMAAQQAISRADAISHLEYETYLRDHRFPSLNTVLGLPAGE